MAPDGVAARCPRCGCDAAAVAVTFWLPPGRAEVLRSTAEIVRRELGLPTAGDAVLAATSRRALELNQQQ